MKLEWVELRPNAWQLQYFRLSLLLYRDDHGDDQKWTVKEDGLLSHDILEHLEDNISLEAAKAEAIRAVLTVIRSDIDHLSALANKLEDAAKELKEDAA